MLANTYVNSLKQEECRNSRPIDPRPKVKWIDEDQKEDLITIIPRSKVRKIQFSQIKIPDKPIIRNPIKVLKMERSEIQDIIKNREDKYSYIKHEDKKKIESIAEKLILHKSDIILRQPSLYDYKFSSYKRPTRLIDVYFI